MAIKHHSHVCVCVPDTLVGGSRCVWGCPSIRSSLLNTIPLEKLQEISSGLAQMLCGTQRWTVFWSSVRDRHLDRHTWKVQLGWSKVASSEWLKDFDLSLAKTCWSLEEMHENEHTLTVVVYWHFFPLTTSYTVLTCWGRLQCASKGRRERKKE